ncbi:MAG: MogA/MoaB family molybdenum cofactor biosynthesis protein [Anaerolineaceae bacterium]|jgi:molybdenum cofactor synthesis domain-containing protein
MIKFGVLTISDRSSQGIRPDSSGPALVDAIQKEGWEAKQSKIIPDEIGEIKNTLIDWCKDSDFDIILTTGGTGFAPRDITPEATLAVLEKQTPGIVEAIRSESMKITKHAMLSRAVAGIRNKTLIINFPGSPKAAIENFNFIKSILPHAVELIQNSPTSEQHHNPMV